MFDKIYNSFEDERAKKVEKGVYSGVHYNENKNSKDITIKNYNAPTIESVKLLREMEEQVLRNILSAGTVNNNIFSYKYIIYTESVYDLQKHLLIEFVINGIKYVKKKELGCISTIRTINKEIVKNIIDTVSEIIKETIMDILVEDESFIQDIASLIKE